MKKATAILCIIISLFGQTELHQFFRLSILISHYREHHAMESQGLISFISSHYIKPEAENKKEDNKHQQLPFKSADSSKHPDTILLHKNRGLFQLVLQTNLPVYYYYDEAILHAASSGIFHPPRC